MRLELGTDPNVADSPPVYPSLDDTNFAPLTLRVGAMGSCVVTFGFCR